MYGDSIHCIDIIWKYKIVLEWIFKRTISIDEIYILVKSEISRLRVCRDCLLNKGYIRFYWRFKDYSVCHIHGADLFFLPSLDYNNSANYESLNMCRFQPRHKHLIALIKHSQMAVNALSVIRDEMYLISYERLLINKICCFFNKQFKLRLKGKFAIKCIESGCFIGLSMGARVDMLIYILCRKHKRYLSRVKIMSILFAVETGYSDANVYYSWAVKESLRTSEIYNLYEVLNSTCSSDIKSSIKKLTPFVAQLYTKKVIRPHGFRIASAFVKQETWIYDPKSIFKHLIFDPFYFKYPITI